MAFAHVESLTANGTGTTATTSALSVAPSSGDLVIIYINRNDSTAISTPTGGTAFQTDVTQETPPSGETASHTVFWKVAGGSEPTTYSAALNSSSAWQAIVRVFSSATDAEFDSFVHSVEATSVDEMICDAIDGDVIPDDALSIIFAGKDNSSGGESYDSATPTDYIGEIGDSEGRYSAGAYKIYTTGTTFSGDVTISPTATLSADPTYNYHIIFTESASVTAALTEDITDEADLVAGGNFVKLVLTGDTFVTGTSSEDGIAGGSDSDKTGANKWDAVVKTDLDNADVVLSTTTETNDTATITLPAYASYDTDEQEVITWTIPAASLTLSGSDIIATPTFTVDPVTAGVSGSHSLLGVGF